MLKTYERWDVIEQIKQKRWEKGTTRHLRGWHHGWLQGLVTNERRQQGYTSTLLCSNFHYACLVCERKKIASEQLNLGAQEMHPKVSCCNSLCNMGNISIQELSYLPRGECIASWRRIEYFTSSLGEGEESGFNAWSSICTGTDCIVRACSYTVAKEIVFSLKINKQKKILVNFFSFLLSTLHLSEQ